MTDNNKIMISKVAPFGLRLLPRLKRDLDAVAEANGRSLNAEITARLEWSLAPEANFARHQDALKAGSELAAKGILQTRLTNAPNPIEERLTNIEARIAALEKNK